jgi:hypothetical protein
MQIIGCPFNRREAKGTPQIALGHKEPYMTAWCFFHLFFFLLLYFAVLCW